MREIERARHSFLEGALHREPSFIAGSASVAAFGSRFTLSCTVRTVAILAILVGACRETAAPAVESATDQTRVLATPAHPEGESKQSEESGLAELGAWEEAEREKLDVKALPSFEKISGSNPTALVALSKTQAAVLLRGDSRVLVVDGEGKTVSSATSPPSPVAGVLVGSDKLWVIGEGSPEIWIYKFDGTRLQLKVRLQVPGATSLRALAVESGKRAFVADDLSGAVLEVRRANHHPAILPHGDGSYSEGAGVRELDRCHAPLALALQAGQLAALCSSSHQLRRWDIRSVPPSNRKQALRQMRKQFPWTPVKKLPSITHDGPLWSVAFSSSEASQTPVVLLSGIENRPLDRSDQGSFGFIDSFVFAYRIPNGGGPEPLASINVGEHGLITPKWIEGSSTATSSEIRVASYGGSSELAIRFAQREFSGSPSIESTPIVPGTTDHVSLASGALYANPLLDGLVVGNSKRRLVRIAASTPDTRAADSRLGELLFFTELMSPWASSEGRRSRFSCEACHFEGYVDGRIHYTGRRDVIATSRPLRGLFNNRPTSLAHLTRPRQKWSTTNFGSPTNSTAAIRGSK